MSSPRAPSRGARFTVYLPALPAAETIAIEREPEGAERTFGRHGRSSVEDDNAVREFTAEALRGAGWTVLLASGPADALAIAARETQRDRPAAHRRRDARHERRHAGMTSWPRFGLGCASLFVSGYSEEDVMGRGGLAPGRAILEKPFTPPSSGWRIRQLLQPSA